MPNKVISCIKGKVFRIAKSKWDYQYSIGRWDFLRTKEIKRLTIARNFLSQYVSGGRILEIGCGEGVFFRNAVNRNYSFYEGIDISEIAISRIDEVEKCTFKAADMESYIPSNGPFFSYCAQ